MKFRMAATINHNKYGICKLLARVLVLRNSIIIFMTKINNIIIQIKANRYHLKVKKTKLHKRLKINWVTYILGNSLLFSYTKYEDMPIKI